MDHGEPDDGLTQLRGAAAAVARLDDGPGADATEHADRFEALHEALTAALADAATPSDRA